MSSSLPENTPTQRLEAFVHSFLPCERRIAAYVSSLVPNRVDAEDITQDVSVVLWEKFESFTPGTDFASWACRIAFLKVLNYRRLKPRPLSLSEEVLEKVSAKFGQMGSVVDAEQEILLQCINELTNSQRNLVLQRHFANRTLDIVADEIKISIPTLRKRLQTVYSLLMDCISRRLHEENL